MRRERSSSTCRIANDDADVRLKRCEHDFGGDHDLTSDGGDTIKAMDSDVAKPSMPPMASIGSPNGAVSGSTPNAISSQWRISSSGIRSFGQRGMERKTEMKFLSFNTLGITADAHAERLMKLKSAALGT